ncbi:hypothetical protein B0H16DRAFT_1684640 [Mycena metata]|uniref:Uncharacterized protein n=1 Tax=Mycena metata TaxID=1033252 RepID=A0AAD7NU23_9AGAR|nr:hypothetical protein B0H16DRAFT_1684640 [Mycena metata]
MFRVSLKPSVMTSESNSPVTFVGSSRDLVDRTASTRRLPAGTADARNVVYESVSVNRDVGRTHPGDLLYADDGRRVSGDEGLAVTDATLLVTDREPAVADDRSVTLPQYHPLQEPMPVLQERGEELGRQETEIVLTRNLNAYFDFKAVALDLVDVDRFVRDPVYLVFEADARRVPKTVQPPPNFVVQPPPDFVDADIRNTLARQLRSIFVISSSLEEGCASYFVDHNTRAQSWMDDIDTDAFGR